MDPVRVMEAIARKRTVFHSEADFQHAFAWELHRQEPGWDIRLEVPVRTEAGSIYLDLLARSGAGEVAIELKYKTRALSLEVDGETFSLRNHAAQDIGRYDFFKDISRIETFANSGPERQGYAIFLTNDSAYWHVPAGAHLGYAAFAMNDGREVAGSLCWGASASEGTREGRNNDINVCGSYRLKWVPYSTLAVNAYREFRYLCIKGARFKHRDR